MIQLELWHLVSLAITLIGTYVGLIKVVLNVFQSKLDVQQQAQEKINKMTEYNSKDLNELKATLPISYVRREDWIRSQATLEAKLDALQEILMKIYRKE